MTPGFSLAPQVLEWLRTHGRIADCIRDRTASGIGLRQIQPAGNEKGPAVTQGRVGGFLPL